MTVSGYAKYAKDIVIELAPGAKALESSAKAISAILDLLSRKGQPDRDDVSIIRTSLTEAQQTVLAAQQSMLQANQAQIASQEMIFMLQQENIALKKRVAEMDSFNMVRDQYEIKAFVDYSFVYAPKSHTDNIGKTPLLCVPCFDKSQKSVLQFKERQFHKDSLECPVCKTIAFVPNDNKPEYIGIARDRSLL